MCKSSIAIAMAGGVVRLLRSHLKDKESLSGHCESSGCFCEPGGLVCFLLLLFFILLLLLYEDNPLTKLMSSYFSEDDYLSTCKCNTL